MKKKDLIDLKTKTAKDLAKMAADKKLEARKIKMDSVAGKEKNLKAGKKLRRDIAQILTIIREKEIVERLEVKKTASPARQNSK